MQAYVLIQTGGGGGGGGALAGRLLAIPGVVEAVDVGGAYDAIALARAGSTRDLSEQVIPQIMALPGVTRALPAPLILSHRGGADQESSEVEQEGSRHLAA